MGVAYISRGKPPINLITKEITKSGIYNASSDNCDGYNRVVVNVESTGNSNGYDIELIPEFINAIIGEYEEVEI